MKITITVQEALDRDIWVDVANIAGYRHDAISGGLRKGTEVILTPEQAEELGLIKIVKSDERQ